MQTQGTPSIENDAVKYAYEQEAFKKVIKLEPTPSLQFFPTAEGFYDFENSEYIYQYKDHLGNVRVSYKKDGSSVEITDQNDYYPFGMNIPREEESKVGTASLYNYKYNGKELQETGMYDYGARFYMPDIGRWGVVDPLAEKMPSFSPYVYTFNNPIMFTDPTGMEPNDWILKDNLWSYDENITTVEQARATPGVTGFAKNGTIINTENGYARLEENNNVNWLPTEGLQNQITNYLAYMSPANSTTTWDPQTFPQFTDPGGMARTDLDASSWDKYFSGVDRLEIVDIGNLPTPQKAANVFLGNIAEALKNIESTGWFDSKYSKSNSNWNNTILSIPDVDSLKKGVLYDKDTIIKTNIYDWDKTYKPASDSSLNRNLRWIENIRRK